MTPLLIAVDSSPAAQKMIVAPAVNGRFRGVSMDPEHWATSTSAT